jgi:hypothetical protein
MLAQTFQIHVRGALPADLLEDFEYLDTVVVPAETVITGVLPDQSALYGVLLRLQALGVELVEVRRIEPGAAGEWSGPSLRGTRLG